MIMYSVCFLQIQYQFACESIVKAYEGRDKVNTYFVHVLLCVLCGVLA